MPEPAAARCGRRSRSLAYPPRPPTPSMTLFDGSVSHRLQDQHEIANMAHHLRLHILSAAAVVLATCGAQAQARAPDHGLAGPAPQQAAPAEPDAVEEVVIEARRSGAPMWQITKGQTTILLVGEITEVPKATPWRPDRLETATAHSEHVILGVQEKVSPADVFRLFWRGAKIVQLPKGETVADFLTPQQLRRLIALEQKNGRSYQRQHPLVTATDLLNRLKFNRNTTDDASDVVRRTARRNSIPTRPVGRVYGDELVDSLLQAPPAAHVPCLDAAMAAAEAGEGVVRERGDAWTRFDVPKVMASPLERALGACFPWGDPRFGPELRGQWTDAVSEALKTPGVTLGVAPLRVLAEKGGVLDRLHAEGLQIEGPAWRPRDQGAN
ncbi:TraB/GumN family protein [Caulobacter rhizosphaerae]|nr:TraB/GumN family protein [Caulobacter rhizosphaerae]